MTEKQRFKCVSDYDWWGVIDITGEIKGEYDNDCFSTDTVVDLLNELAEENQDLHKKEVELGQNYLRLLEENEQLKTQLSEAKADEKQLGISFMGYKMKLIEVLRKKYDKVKGKTLYADVYTEIAEEMGVDLE